MIFGIGTDIVEIQRMSDMQSQDTFAKKILGLDELKSLNDLQVNKKANYLAKQFAGKEAFVKALGTGFKDPVFPQDIQIIRNASGKPEFKISNSVKSHLKGLGITGWHVSLDDERNHVVAFAVLEHE